MRRKIFGNILMAVLFATLIFQASFLWISFKSKPDKKENRDGAVLNVPNPDRLIINDKKHLEKRNLSSLRNKFSPKINKYIRGLKEKDLKSITKAEYIDSLKDSITLFYRGMGLELPTGSKISQLVITKSGNVFAKADRYYQLKDMDLDITELLSLSSVREFKTFKEVYGIDSEVFLPVFNDINMENIYYENALDEIEKNQKNALAESFLKISIDYIRQISQENEDIYVHDNKFLSLDEDSVLNYKLEGELNDADPGLKKALEEAYSFIESVRIQTNDLYLMNVKKTDEGYEMSFGLFQDGWKVLPVDPKEGYINLVTSGNQVKSYSAILRIKENNPNFELKNIKLMNFRELIKKNLHIFKKATDKEVLTQIDNLDIVLIDPISSEHSPLRPAYEIKFGNSYFYFDIEDGKYYMEKR